MSICFILLSVTKTSPCVPTVEDFENVCDPDQPSILDENVEGFFMEKKSIKGLLLACQVN